MRVWVTDDVHECLLDGLKENGFQVDYQPDVTLEYVREHVGAYAGIIINSKIKADQTLMRQAANLKFIGRLGSGLNIIDLQEAKKRAIQVISVPEGNRQAVAEHALGMLLSLFRNIPRADDEVKNGTWHREKNRGTELQGKVVGIIGFGNTGSSFARILSGFGCHIIAYDKYLTDYAQEYPYVASYNLDQLLHKADIISLHIPLTTETLYCVNKEFFGKCKNGVTIINTSRGKVLKLSDLLKSLENGKVSGACLDVFENEKPWTYEKEESDMYEELYRKSNVILSPHIAGWTVESKYKIGKHMLEKILNIVNR